MSERARVEGWFEQGRLVRPDPGVRNGVDLARALAAAAGADLGPLGFDSPGARDLAARIGEAAHLVFVLVDGLGVSLLERLDGGGFLRGAQAGELRSVFPSATASAVTSLATGAWPAQHAVPGWWTRLPEHDLTAVALPFVDRATGTPLEKLGISTAVYPAGPLLAHVPRDARVVQPGRLAGSAYSRYLCGPARSLGYRDLAGGVDAVLERVEGAAAPTYTYLYAASVDKVCHDHGPAAEEALAELRAVEAELARLAAGLARHDARLVISADHGLIAPPQEAKHVLPGDDPLAAELIDAPSGEPRAPLFHVRAGREGAFAAAFAERFGHAFALLSLAEVEDLELYGPGPLGPEARARLGSFLALSPGPDVLLPRMAGVDEPQGMELMVGFHGGLLPDEVRIPLILA